MTTAVHSTSASRNGKLTENHDAAQHLAEAGFAVIPLHWPLADGKCSCGGKGCKRDGDPWFKGKHPRTKNGLDDATRAAGDIRKWWTAWPQANVGLAMGDVSAGAVAIDIDDGGLFSQFCARISPSLLKRLTIQRTPRGFHLVFRCAEPGVNQKLAVDGMDPKHRTFIETRANGGYIMAAPSMHPSGKQYELIQGDWNTISFLTEDEVEELLAAARSFDVPAPNPLAKLVVLTRDVSASPPKPVVWQTHKYQEVGELVLDTAPPGSLKSLFRLYWACCVASGRLFLPYPDGSGGFATRQANVIWLNTDNSETTHENRLRAILRSLRVTDIPLFSVTTTEFELANPEHIKNLHLLADDHEAGVIVIDTLSGCLPGINENTAEEMTVPVAHLRALASGRTVVGLHHPPKNDAEGSRGSSVLPGKVDRSFSLSRDSDLLAVKPQKVRNTPGQAFVALAAIDSDPATEALNGVAFFSGDESRRLADIRRTEESIRDALAAGALNTKQLTKTVKGRDSLILSTANAMAAAGGLVVEPGVKGSKIFSLPS